MLNIEYNKSKIWIINPLIGRKDNSGYNAPFPVWWSKFGLKGDGYLIGEDTKQGKFIREKLGVEYPVQNIHSVDICNADIIIDITKDSLPHKVDFIFCMAVLEHVQNPWLAIHNMSKALNPGGLLCLSVPINGFKQHRRPLDCYRFLEDSMQAFAEIGNLELLDYAPLIEWCSIYRK